MVTRQVYSDAHCSSQNLDQAVLAVGYGTTSSGTFVLPWRIVYMSQYIILRNFRSEITVNLVEVLYVSLGDAKMLNCPFSDIPRCPCVGCT